MKPTGSILLAAVLFAPGHPVHTSVAELREIRAGAPVEISLRVFADDLTAAVPSVNDSAVSAYIRGAFVITDRYGRAVPLSWQGMDRTGDALVLRLAAQPVGGLSGAAVAHGVLLERFDDQINVIRASYRGRTATFLFVPGDGAKRLP